MEHAEAMALLPFPYATALRLAEQGATDSVIAHAVDVEPEAVPNLLRLARSKLDELTEESP
jgi:DNA-directed RNA polymerase specialized sigma24 family protein